MSSSKKVILGFLTFLPLILTLAYFVFFISFFTSAMDAEMNHDGNPAPSSIAGNISMMILFIVAAMLVSLGMLIYYLIHAVNNKSFDKNKRLMWILILVLANGIGNIIYFFMEIVPNKAESIEEPNGA